MTIGGVASIPSQEEGLGLAKPSPHPSPKGRGRSVQGRSSRKPSPPFVSQRERESKPSPPSLSQRERESKPSLHSSPKGRGSLSPLSIHLPKGEGDQYKGIVSLSREDESHPLAGKYFEIFFKTISGSSRICSLVKRNTRNPLEMK
jgi:hypothetical protein